MVCCFVVCLIIYLFCVFKNNDYIGYFIGFKVLGLGDMVSDDFIVFLGMGKWWFVWLLFGFIGVGLISVVFMMIIIWIVVVDDLFGGELVVVLLLDEVVEGIIFQDIEVVEIWLMVGGDFGLSLRWIDSVDFFGL